MFSCRGYDILFEGYYRDLSIRELNIAGELRTPYFGAAGLCGVSRDGGKEGVSVVSVNGDGKGGLQDVDSPFLRVLLIYICICR